MKKSEKQKITINYGEAISVLPSKVLEHIDKAKKFDIKLLILLSSSEKYREGKYTKALAEALGVSETEVENSISFWRGTGVLTLDGSSNVKMADKTTQKEESVDVPKRAKVTELPQYNTKELNALLEKNKFVVGLIDECQNILGKIFTASEIRVIMGLVEYLGLDHDYILVLMHYSAKVDMKSMRYIEKLALSCLDEGYTEAAVLQEALYAKEEKHKIEGKIKSIFGLGTRKLTSKEEKQINAWINEFKFDLEIIEKAYELTVGATNNPSIHYANAILEKWNAEGIKTIDDVNAILDEREQKKAEDGASSFNVDEFFDAALKRSYSEK